MRAGFTTVAGFTTIEVMIALVLCTVGVLALARGAATLVRVDGDSWRRVRGALAAENRLEATYAACPDSGTGLIVVAYAVPRAGRPALSDTLASVFQCA